MSTYDDDDFDELYPEEDGPARAGWWDRFVESSLTVVNLAALWAGLVILMDIDVPGRSWAAVVLVLFGPGSGIVLLIGRFDPALRWVLTIGVSVACSILTAQLLLSLHTVESSWGAAVLTTITAASLIRLAQSLGPAEATR